jgi:hypothetical protein
MYKISVIRKDEHDNNNTLNHTTNKRRNFEKTKRNIPQLKTRRQFWLTIFKLYFNYISIKL